MSVSQETNEWPVGEGGGECRGGCRRLTRQCQKATINPTKLFSDPIAGVAVAERRLNCCARQRCTGAQTMRPRFFQISSVLPTSAHLREIGSRTASFKPHISGFANKWNFVFTSHSLSHRRRRNDPLSRLFLLFNAFVRRSKIVEEKYCTDVPQTNIKSRPLRDSTQPTNRYRYDSASGIEKKGR